MGVAAVMVLEARLLLLLVVLDVIFDRLARVFFLPAAVAAGLPRVRGSIASSGDMDPEAARFSRSSRRRFNFLPGR